MSVTCGRCTKFERQPVKHDTSADVRACYAAPVSFSEEWARAELAAEAAAEAAAERFYEEGTAAQAAQYRWEVEQDERRALGF